MIKISICICTRKRLEGLKNLLDSITKMQTPPDTEIFIIIVENDLEPYSEKTVMEFASRCKFGISYFLETKQGIAYARNRSVKETGDCDFCCFVDDDQIVNADWLVELIKCQVEFNADGVYGCCLASLNKDVAPYVRKSHERSIYEYGTILKTAATGGLLLKRKFLDLIQGPFDIRFNYIGGEDTYLTKMITNAGGVIRYTPNAIAYEVIPPDRTTITYIIRRIYRLSNVRLLRKSLIDKNLTILNTLPRLLIRFLYGLLIFIPFFCLGKANKLKGLIIIFDAIGGIAFFLGGKDEFYK